MCQATPRTADGLAADAESLLEDIQLQGSNRFLNYQVPGGIIKLKQTFGRLVRSRTDRGLVAILDPGLPAKP